MRLIDNNKVVYPSIRDFCRVHGVSRSHMTEQLKKDNQYFNKRLNLVAYIVDESEIDKHLTQENNKTDADVKIIEQLKERYSDDELKLLCKGEGLKDISLYYPKYNFSGKKHKLLILSDTHIGSKYTPPRMDY